MTDEELTDRRLKIAYWFVTHKARIRQIGIGFLIFIDAALVLYAVIGAVFFVVGQKRDKALMKELIENDAVFSNFHNFPDPLEPGLVLSIPTGDRKIDLYARVLNPNEDWGVRLLKYHFSLGGSPLDEQEAFLLPGAEQALVQFGVPRSTGEADLVISDIKWARLAPASLRDHGVVVENTRVTRPLPTLPAKLQFRARNTASLGYWNIDFIIVGISGRQTTGVTKTSIQEFGFGEKREIEVPLSGGLAIATRFIIDPQVNIFDENVFMPFRVEGSGEVK